MTVTLFGRRYLPASLLPLLGKYAPNAHLYLPGPLGGVIQGLQPGNYQESAGTTLSGVDDPVGLVLDAAGGGINASQPTQIYRPTLRDTGGKYAFECGASKYLDLQPLFQMSDDFCIISGVSLASSEIEKAIYSHSNLSNFALPEFMFNRQGKLGIYAYGGGTLVNAFGGPNNVGVGPIVATAVSRGGVCSVRRNGVEVATATFGGTYGTATQAAIGAFATVSRSEFMSGLIYPSIIIKANVSPEDVIEFERFVTTAI